MRNGDTDSNEIEFVPATIIARSAGLPKAVLNDPRSWATANGIRFRCFGGMIYFAAVDVDNWRPKATTDQTVEPEPSKPVAGLAGPVVEIEVSELAALRAEVAAMRSRLSSLDNSVLLMTDAVNRSGEPEPDEADYFDLTDLGKPHGWTAIRMNKALTAIGLQIDQRKPNGLHDKYLLTQAGHAHGRAFKGYPSKNGFQGRHVKWKASIIGLIRPELNTN